MQHGETEDARTERIELLVTPQEKALLMWAAAIEHLDITSFVMRAALPAAQEVVERTENIPSSERDMQKTQQATGEQRKRTGEDLIAFFRNSPLAEIGLELERELERDKATGTNTWSEFFDFARSIDVPTDFMAERPMNVPPQTRGLFDGEKDNE